MLEQQWKRQVHAGQARLVACPLYHVFMQNEGGVQASNVRTTPNGY